MVSYKDVYISLAGMPYATGNTEVYGIHAEVMLSEAVSFIHFHHDTIDMETMGDIFVLMIGGYTMGIEAVVENPDDYDLFDEDTARELIVDEAWW